MASRALQAQVSVSRQESLRVRHADLSSRIEEEERRPSRDETRIRRLKVERMHLKEALVGIQAETVH